MKPCILVKPNHSSGYRRYRIDGKLEYAHRVAYIAANGVIPDGYVIDHLCETKHCIEPTHLEAVTQNENAHRYQVNHPQGHCPHGNGATSRCRVCHAQRTRRWRERHA